MTEKEPHTLQNVGTKTGGAACIAALVAIAVMVTAERGTYQAITRDPSSIAEIVLDLGLF